MGAARVRRRREEGGREGEIECVWRLERHELLVHGLWDKGWGL